jgi:hypothetical protein
VIDSTEEHVGRLVLDAVSYSWFSLRGKYEWSSKRGTIDPHALERMTGTGCTPAATATCVEHEGMRHYDIAERDRNRVTVIASLNPFNTLGFNFSAGTGHDDYLNTEFGLLDNRHFVYTGGVDYTPAENVLFSTSYAYERYEGLSRSRQATRPQFFDVTRNWSTDTTDKAHSLIATAEFSLGKLAVRVLYDYNLVNSTYIYGTGPIPDRTLPEESDVVASTLPDPKQLPPTRSEAHRGSVDFLYPLNKRVSAGFSYWYDAYDVDDFTLDENANPSLDRGSVLLLGYIYKPYTAQTFWGRIVFRF